MIKKNKTNQAPSPVGNYPHSIEVNGVLYLSGIGPRNSKDNSIDGNSYDQNKNLIDYDIEKQTHAVFKNIKSILEVSNSKWENIVDITVFLTNMKKDFNKFNEIYNSYFPDSHSCRTTVEVNSLPTDIAVELKCIAIVNK
jgi:2-aminomuconate deaminase